MNSDEIRNRIQTAIENENDVLNVLREIIDEAMGGTIMINPQKIENGWTCDEIRSVKISADITFIDKDWVKAISASISEYEKYQLAMDKAKESMTQEIESRIYKISEETMLSAKQCADELLKQLQMDILLSQGGMELLVDMVEEKYFNTNKNHHEPYDKSIPRDKYIKSTNTKQSYTLRQPKFHVRRGLKKKGYGNV